MTALLVLGAKGGVGTSLFVTNLALLIARNQECLLLDAQPAHGTDDMLLNMRASRSWFDLLPVASELDPHHLELASMRHGSGLRLLSAPEKYVESDPSSLIPPLTEHCQWLLVDGWPCGMRGVVDRFDRGIVLTTLDPPALRGAARATQELDSGGLRHLSLVINQWSKSHPLSPWQVARSLGVPLLAVLPFAPRAVGDQIEMGRPIVSHRQSPYTKSVEAAVASLLDAAGGEGPLKARPQGANCGC